jgi:hypothetical protein
MKIYIIKLIHDLMYFYIIFADTNTLLLTTAQHVFQYVHQFVLNLSLAVSDLRFPLLSIFHTHAVKFVLVYNKIWSLWSEIIWAQENQIIEPGYIYVKCFLWKHNDRCAVTAILWYTCQTWDRQNALAELLLY